MKKPYVKPTLFHDREERGVIPPAIVAVAAAASLGAVVGGAVVSAAKKVGSEFMKNDLVPALEEVDTTNYGRVVI